MAKPIFNTCLTKQTGRGWKSPNKKNLLSGNPPESEILWKRSLTPYRQTKEVVVPPLPRLSGHFILRKQIFPLQKTASISRPSFAGFELQKRNIHLRREPTVWKRKTCGERLAHHRLGADEGTWTHTVLLPLEPESSASANSATSAYIKLRVKLYVGCGGRTWTSDLRVMSPTSYQLLHSAISYPLQDA